MSQMETHHADPTPSDQRRRLAWWMTALPALAAVIVVVIIVAARGESDKPSVDSAATPAPDVTFPLLDGGQSRISDFAGQPVVLNFFASWCGPCRREMPDLQAASQAHGDRIRFIGLSVTDQEDATRELLELTGVDYLIGRDDDGEILRAYGGLGMPTTAFIRADGTLADVHIGILDRATLDGIIAEELL